MDKAKELENSFNHGITISERKNIKGDELEIIKLDTYQGNVYIKGKVDGMSYIENGSKKEKEETFLNKLFK